MCGLSLSGSLVLPTSVWVALVPKWCPFALAKQAAHPRPRLHPGDVGVDAQGHARIAVAHLGGGDRGVLAKLGTQRGVGPAERMKGDALGNLDSPRYLLSMIWPTRLR
jgi:hypothetical protein